MLGRIGEKRRDGLFQVLENNGLTVPPGEASEFRVVIRGWRPGPQVLTKEISQLRISRDDRGLHDRRTYLGEVGEILEMA